MPEQLIASPAPGIRRRPRGGDPSGRSEKSRTTAAWAAVASGVIVVGVAWVVSTGMRPSYDAFGWLVWGRQVLHWNLNTDGAPSWKPLTFLFTLPYALAGANPQLWLWMITSSAGALAGGVFGARIAFWLTGPFPRRRWARWAAAAFAGIGVLGINGYSEQVLIANSDPIVVTLCLAAIDSHLRGRRRLAFALVVLASLGRPEGWAFAGLYALWAWRAVPSMRVLVTAGVVLIPLSWFTVPALTSHSWFISGDLALNSATVIHGNKILGVIDRLRSLYEPPMQLAVAVALALAVVRRDREWLGLAAAAGLWVAIEIAFAYHGWSAVPRYLIEPASVLVVLAGAGVGRVLAWEPRSAGAPSGGLPGTALARRVLRWTPAAVVAMLVVALVPAARTRVRVAQGELRAAHHANLELTRLEAVIATDDGAAAIKACGQPVTLVGYQSELAWAVGLNVGNVGYRPGRSIDQGIPIVIFKPHDDGWQVRPIHMLAADTSRCDRLRTNSELGSSG
ncbi:MAG: hypothetical protein ACLP50_09070 [Solirubrobacteraceae bacterium]